MDQCDFVLGWGAASLQNACSLSVLTMNNFTSFNKSPCLLSSILCVCVLVRTCRCVFVCACTCLCLCVCIYLCVHMIIILIIIITLKGTNQDFTIPSLHCKLCPTHILKWPCCNHVQIIKRHNMQHVMYHGAQSDSSAIKFDRVKITFSLALFYWLKPLADEGG